MVKPIVRDAFFWHRNRARRQRMMRQSSQICSTHFRQMLTAAWRPIPLEYTAPGAGCAGNGSLNEAIKSDVEDNIMYQFAEENDDVSFVWKERDCQKGV